MYELTMPFIAFLKYPRSGIPVLPWKHWVAMGLISLVVALIAARRNKYSVLGSIALGCTMMVSLFLLDALVLHRIGVQIEQHPEFNISAEYHRLFHGNAEHRVAMLLNVLIFIPFGLCLSAFLSAAKRCSAKRNIGLVALVAFLFSLCLESLQWILRVGLFELTDMVLNTAGAVIGAAIALGIAACCKKK